MLIYANYMQIVYADLQNVFLVPFSQLKLAERDQKHIFAFGYIMSNLQIICINLNIRQSNIRKLHTPTDPIQFPFYQSTLRKKREPKQLSSGTISKIWLSRILVHCKLMMMYLLIIYIPNQ